MDRVSAIVSLLSLTYSLSKSYACTLHTHFCYLLFRFRFFKKYLKLLWSVLTTKHPPAKDCLNFFNACMMANIYLSYIGYWFVRSLKFMISKAIGCQFCINTAHIPSSDASHSSTKGCVNFGSANTGKVLITFVILSNVACASYDHQKVPFLVRPVNGAPSCENIFTKHL
jgi:hypothetical protein